MNNDYLNTTGRIFDIQRFSVHDGPGVRTIIFLKGCFLRCKWCCNPESQKREIETMIVDGKEKVMGRDVTVEELITEIEKDRIYYQRSGGGVTLSGGESLAQPDFAAAILRACKEKGINTALESTACAKYENIQKLLPYLDLYLMDIKHINSEKHKQFTTQPNELILENAKKLAVDAKKLIIRVPVIPTFNDTMEEIRGIAEFTKSLGTVEELHLLPYHRLGEDKYKGLGRNYELHNIELIPDEKIQELKKVVEDTGLKCQIGG
ncbi:MAG: glycyl-radical enzyme activating protein [Ruminococcaceae bacterium]|nr:glycyl-radical enzyme activating protein [Oscillospiraceae bacterium]